MRKKFIRWYRIGEFGISKTKYIDCGIQLIHFMACGSAAVGDLLVSGEFDPVSSGQVKLPDYASLVVLE